MTFPVSGVHCPFWLPPAVAFVIALLAAPTGISGAFLLLPFQMSVLGFVSPGVTPTNLIYNTVAIPGGVYRYAREGRLAWPLARIVIAGTLPGVCLGAIIRLRYLPDPRHWKLFVGVVLLYLAVRLLRASQPASSEDHLGGGIRFELRGEQFAFRPAPLAAVALLTGIAGGIYGVGGGAMIAPFAMGVLRLPARAVAGATLAATLVTSLTGALFFQVLATLGMGGAPARPDWELGLLFGAGGLVGSYCGARLQKHLPERWLRRFLGLLLAGVALSYLATPLAAQCLVENPGAAGGTPIVRWMPTSRLPGSLRSRRSTMLCPDGSASGALRAAARTGINLPGSVDYEGL
ncbi:MAG TPA: sulfite exporter TauE/SafE family protein [Bryobacteraceae bacterium]|nr:sulfite exporter TauE/SafE family protein [Bryobacteraceae bacterium]